MDVVRKIRVIAEAAGALAVVLAGVAACGGGSAPAPATPAPTAHVTKSTLDPAVVAANKTMAAGVPIGESTAPVESRFDLDVVPAPGKEFTVRVAVLPSAPAPVLRLEVTAPEGLVVLSPENAVTQEKVTAGSVVPLEVRALSQEAGPRVLYVKATLDLPDGPQTRTFAYPILVGAAAAPPPAAPAKGAGPAKSAR